MFLKRFLTSLASFSLLTGAGCLVSSELLAGPRDTYKNISECIENPDFVSSKAETLRYCLTDSGLIQTIDQDGNLNEEEDKLDQLIEDKKKTGLFGGKSLEGFVEYKVEEDELIEYRCKAEKVDSKYQCVGSAQRIIKGVRPNEYYLKKGLEKVEDEQWQESIEDFSNEIELNKTSQAYFHRAYSKLVIEDYLGAVKDINVSIKNKSNNLKAYNIRSYAKYQLNDYKGAIKDLNKLIVLLESMNQADFEKLEIKDDLNDFDKFYFRRGLANSELGNKQEASSDFAKEIKRNPLFGQAYFQRGLENYWQDRDLACTDMLKGLSLDAEDTSDALIQENQGSESFLNELFDNDNSLISACQSDSNKKVEQNKESYDSEQFAKKVLELLKKYILLIPIIIIIIFTIIIKYTNKDD